MPVPKCTPASTSGGYWLNVLADLDARFRIETTSDLLQWSPGDGIVRKTGLHGPVAMAAEESVFFRAVAVP